MEGEGVLWVICEVAIGFAGFTGIVAVFGHGVDGWGIEDVVRFRSLWLASLSTILLALFPFVLFHLGVAEPLIWRVCSLLFVMFLVFVFFFEFRQTRSVIPSLSRMDIGWAVVISGFGIVVLALLAWNSVREAPTVGPYLAGLVQHLFVCSVMFGLHLTKRVATIAGRQ